MKIVIGELYAFVKMLDHFHYMFAGQGTNIVPICVMHAATSWNSATK